jgi:hypothetical protein
MPVIPLHQIEDITDAKMVSSILKDKVTHACGSFWIEPVTDIGAGDVIQVGGTPLTEDGVGGTEDTIAAQGTGATTATHIAGKINAHSVLGLIVQAVAYGSTVLCYSIDPDPAVGHTYDLVYTPAGATQILLSNALFESGLAVGVKSQAGASLTLDALHITILLAGGSVPLGVVESTSTPFMKSLMVRDADNGGFVKLEGVGLEIVQFGATDFYAVSMIMDESFMVQVPILAGLGDAAGYTAGVTAGGLETVTRAAAATAESWWASVPLPSHVSQFKGLYPRGMRVNYRVGVAADADDLRCELWKVSQGAHGAARTAAVLFGDADADYDASHDTIAERCAINDHLAVLADAGAPVPLDNGETLLMRFLVDGDVGAAAVMVLTSAIVIFGPALLAGDVVDWAVQVD